MNILVFKTDVENIKQVRLVSPHLRSLPDIIKWNFDLHDCDRVLRIETNTLTPQVIETLLQDAGFFCKELED